MSFILIGLGKQTRQDLGEAGAEQRCAWCSERIVYHLTVDKTWLTVFFIPIYAYDSVYRVECPLCGGWLVIRGEEVRAARQGELTIRRE